MATPISMSEEDTVRVARLVVDVLDLMRTKAVLIDGKLDQETNARLIETSTETLSRLDVPFSLDLADRLGEEALRKGIEESTPPHARASVEALLKSEGSVLSTLKARMSGANAANVTSGLTMRLTDDQVGCGLGAIAIAGGLYGNGVLGGIAVVGGIVLMAQCC
jgi:hypothetical protein